MPRMLIITHNHSGRTPKNQAIYLDLLNTYRLSRYKIHAAANGRFDIFAPLMAELGYTVTITSLDKQPTA
jgi:hypothetical protein